MKKTSGFKRRNKIVFSKKLKTRNWRSRLGLRKNKDKLLRNKSEFKTKKLRDKKLKLNYRPRNSSVSKKKKLGEKSRLNLKNNRDLPSN